MKRRFNFTGRKRIEQAYATIRVDADENGGDVTFEVDLDFHDTGASTRCACHD